MRSAVAGVGAGGVVGGFGGGLDRSCRRWGVGWHVWRRGLDVADASAPHAGGGFGCGECPPHVCGRPFVWVWLLCLGVLMRLNVCWRWGLLCWPLKSNGEVAADLHNITDKAFGCRLRVLCMSTSCLR